jgi:antitoxin (DNA-binding transcriptional repressor) of toxin-antitoxin stability system
MINKNNNGGHMRVSATTLRQNLYQILDEVLDKGIPVEIKRKGQILKIVPEKPKSKLDNLEPHDTIVGDPESIITIDWYKEWQEEKNL